MARPHVPAPSLPAARVPTARALFDGACARLVDAVFAEDRAAAQVAWAEAVDVLERAAVRVEVRS